VGNLPRTSTGWVVDPMTTKLEMMVGYLAGRQGKAAESIRRELEDPTSEASRWLETVRKRSQAVSRFGSPEARALVSPALARNVMTTRGSARKRLLPFLYGVSAAALVFLAMGVAWRAQDDRLLRLETMLAQREARWGTRFDQLNAALTRREVAPPGNTPGSRESVSPQAKPSATVDGSTGLTLARIEARLGEVSERQRVAPSSQNQRDPTIDELRLDVERLRKEVETRAQSSRQESHELSLVVQEVLQLLRQLAMRPWGPEPMQVPVPAPLQEHQRRGGQGPGLMPGAEQVPGQGQMPDQDHSRMDPGQGNRERRSQGSSGSSMGPRMRRPGGPE
jgi:hypothetical protein